MNAERIDLTPLRADGWFDSLCENPEANELRQLLGDDVLAACALLGVQFAHVQTHPICPLLTFFEVEASGQAMRLSWMDLTSQVSDALTAAWESLAALQAPDIARCADASWILFAEQADMRAQALVPEAGQIRVTMDAETLPLSSLLETLSARLLEAATHLQRDALNKLSALETHIDTLDDDAAILRSLSAWPRAVSNLSRTLNANDVSATQLDAIIGLSRSMVAVCRTHEAAAHVADELPRELINWMGDRTSVTPLFVELASAAEAAGRHGEAIGLFRRALNLGARLSDVAAPLARSYAERDRWLGALLVDAHRGDGRGLSDLHRSKCEAALGSPWLRFLEAVSPAEQP